MTKFDPISKTSQIEKQYEMIDYIINPLTLVAISKLLEMIDIVHLYPCVLNRDRSWLRHKSDCRLGWSSKYVKKSIHACHSVCLLHAGQPKRAGDAAKSGEFIGEFSWVEYDPIIVKGLTWKN